MTIYQHQNDLPADLVFTSGAMAIDTEATGLHLVRDRLCVIQVSDGNGDAHIIQLTPEWTKLPIEARSVRLQALLADASLQKIFHFARFDMTILHRFLGVMPHPVCCTKIASRLVRTYTESHSLKELCRELLNITLSKQQQSSDWAHTPLSHDQLQYAANDVLFLHRIWQVLHKMLVREGRLHLADACFSFLATRVHLDMLGWENADIFSHDT